MELGRIIDERIQKRASDKQSLISSLKVDKQASYGTKRDYPKIEILVDGEYKATTTWSQTCKEAKEVYLKTNPDLDPSQVTCQLKDQGE